MKMIQTMSMLAMAAIALGSCSTLIFSKSDIPSFQEIASSRYACKKFSEKQISKQQLDAILEAGRLAPTAKNLQEQHIYAHAIRQQTI